jgi:PAS domain S-box-containing protein
MGQPLRVLIIEDSDDDAALLLRKLRQGGYEPLHERVETAEDMAAALNSKTWDLILSDYRLPRFSGLEALALFRKTGLDVPFLIVSGAIGEDTAVETMRAGAQDYIMKDSLQRLVPAIRRELKDAEDRRLRRRTEAALVETEGHYRELVARMSSAVAVYKANEDGSDFIFTDFNPAAERIEEIKKEDLLGKSILQVFPGVVEFGLFDVLKRVWKTGRPEHFPVSFYKDDRITGWRENYVYMLSSGNIVAIYDDVTEKKKAEESVREAEEKYRHLFMNAQEGIYQTTPEGKLITVNPAMAEIYGYASPEEMIAAIASVERQLYKNPEDRKRFMQLMNTHGEVKNFELEHLAKDGGTLWISTNAHPVYDQGGSLLCYEGTVVDVTERRRAEEELRSAFEKQRELAFIVNHSPATAWLWKAAAGWPVEYVSDSVAELGYVPDDFTGGRVAFASIIHPEDIARVGAEVEEFTKEGRNSFNQEYRIVTGSGDVCWIDDRTWIRRDSDGKATHYQGITIDITSRKRSEESLLKKHAELETAHAELKQAQVRVIQQEKMASIGQLAAGITHEINNPMSFITGNLGILRTYLEGIAEIIAAQEEIARNHAPPEAMEALEDLKKKMKIDYILKDVGHLLDQSLVGADRVRKIVSDLKTFSRIEEEVCLIEDINAALDSTINIVWNEIKYKAELVKEFKDLPPTRCNISHLNQVFMNLLVNAAQSIEQWGKVTVRTWAQEDNIYVSITDTGKGVPEENREKIFEPFFTTKPAGKGTGLGLSISHDIVKRHNGDITVESKVGEGTTFIVRVPIWGS